MRPTTILYAGLFFLSMWLSAFMRFNLNATLAQDLETKLPIIGIGILSYYIGRLHKVEN